jgi:hypothetical protein
MPDEGTTAVTAISPATALEAAMLICFGFSWPIANLRMIRTRRAEGRGLLPTSLTLLGYSAGMAAKIVCACSGAGLAPIFWLYLLNATSVAINLALQRHYSRTAAADGPASGPAPTYGIATPPIETIWKWVLPAMSIRRTSTSTLPPA